MKEKIISNFRNLSLFMFAVIVIWLKTYYAYQFEFKIEVDNPLQEFILFINPFSSVLFFLSIALLLPKKFRYFALIFIGFVLTFILYANIVYHRFFNDYITIPLLFQSGNMGDLGGSVLGLMQAKDILYFIDIIVFMILFKLKKNKIINIRKRSIIFAFSLSFIIFYANLILAEIERPQLLTRSFDREMIIKGIGTYNFHIYDIVVQTKTNAQRAFANEEKLNFANSYIETQKVPPNSEFTGIAEGKNLIIVSMESLQSFTINKKVNGHEVTPFLNSLIKDDQTFYFDNFYHQTAQGKTSDSEFLLGNSLYPLPSGAVFFTHGQNEYIGLPEVLGENGYFSSVFHANNKSFWNRDVIYPNLGFDRYFDIESYTVNDENSVNWGLKDTPFFEQSVEIMKTVEEPFYAQFITLTNHYPFTLKEEDMFIPQYNSNSGTLNRFYPTVRYMDESIKVFFEQLKESGIYENSIIVLYGDHYGISENHNKAMSTVVGRKINEFESTNLQRVPLIIHIPEAQGKTIHEVGGQIDLRPTILNLLGIEETNPITFGNDLFSKEREDFVVLRDGSFITDKVVYTDETCYSKSFGTPLHISSCDPYFEKAEKHLSTSDSIIYGDLLRFLTKEEEQ